MNCYGVELDGIEFDAKAMVSALKKSHTYDEFRILCDVANTDCIITRDEYESLKCLYQANIDNNDYSTMSLPSNFCHVAKVNSI